MPDLQYLMIDGQGDPNASLAFSEAVESLYPVACKMKFTSKVDLGRDYVVPPLEGLWWAEDMNLFTAARDKSRWSWILMLMVPGWIDHDMFVTAIEQAGAKNRPARLEDIRVETLSEGRCVQTLHVGSFDDEAEVLAHFAQRLHPAQRVYHGGQASRDLPQRLPQSRTREAANHPETTDRRGRRVDARRTSPCLLVMCSPADAEAHPRPTARRRPWSLPPGRWRTRATRR